MASGDGSLARNLRALREGLGLTQEDCADGAGLHPVTWSRIEEGRHKRVSSDTLTRIVAFFRREGVALPTDWLLSIELPSSPSPVASSAGDTRPPEARR